MILILSTKNKYGTRECSLVNLVLYVSRSSNSTGILLLHYSRKYGLLLMNITKVDTIQQPLSTSSSIFRHTDSISDYESSCDENIDSIYFFVKSHEHTQVLFLFSKEIFINPLTNILCLERNRNDPLSSHRTTFWTKTI